MNRFISILAGAALSLGVAASAGAASLTQTWTVTISADAANTAGLDGATLAFTGTFNNGTTWQNDGLGNATALFDSHSLTITGASVAANNGVFTADTGYGLLCTSAGPCQGVDDGTNFFGLFTLGTTTLELVHQHDSGHAATVGDFIVEDDLDEAFDLPNWTITTGFFTDFHSVVIPMGGPPAPIITGGSTDPNFGVTTGGDVPLPAGLPLMLAGLAGFGLLRRARKA